MGACYQKRLHARNAHYACCQASLKDNKMKSVYLVWKISTIQDFYSETTTDLEAIYLTEAEAEKHVDKLKISDNLHKSTHRKYEIEQRVIDRWEDN
jgi:hypothetical protein